MLGVKALGIEKLQGQTLEVTLNDFRSTEQSFEMLIE